MIIVEFANCSTIILTIKYKDMITANKHINGINVTIHNYKEVILEVPSFINGDKLSKWYINNHYELQEFKESKLKGYIKSIPFHKDNKINSDDR